MDNSPVHLSQYGYTGLYQVKVYHIMKKLINLFTEKHNFIISKWETKPTAYGQSTERSFATEYACTKCGIRAETPHDFNNTPCL